MGEPVGTAGARTEAPEALSVAGVRALIAQVREDVMINGGEWSRPSVQAMVVQRFGAWRLGIKTRAIRAPLSVVYRWAHRFVRNVYGIEIHATTKVGRRLRLLHQAGITISRDAVIGDDCVIRQGVNIGRAGLDTEPAPTLGDRVVIGVNASVLGGVVVGDDAVIGPHAVVTFDVPPGAVVSAPPSRVVGAPPRRTAGDG